MPVNDLKKIEGLNVKMQVPLAPYTTFRIGGDAGLFLLPSDISSLEKTVSYLAERGIRSHVLGRGSNLLVDDKGVGVVLCINGLTGFEENAGGGNNGNGVKYIKFYAGCSLKKILAWTAHHGLCGLEGLTGIPGSLGGAIMMNAGTKGDSISELVEAVHLTGPSSSRWIKKEALNFTYRGFDLPQGEVISAALLRFSKGAKDEIMDEIKKAMRMRAKTQPLGKHSPGCVFKNPHGDFAGRLIEACGLKGKRIGDAQVSKIHANFIINLGHATCNNVLELMGIIEEKVKRETGVILEPEIDIWRN